MYTTVVPRRCLLRGLCARCGGPQEWRQIAPALVRARSPSGKGVSPTHRTACPMHHGPDHAAIENLIYKAARVQELLKDLEVSLLAPGERTPLAVLRELKAAWSVFRDAAMASLPFDSSRDPPTP